MRQVPAAAAGQDYKLENTCALKVDGRQQDFNLSRRELEVLRKICAGLANRAIADELFISEHTVKDHIKNIMRKMKVSSRNGIVAALPN